MDKNKSEKLKEILNQTLSTEDIEKKLKEEIRNNALKKEKRIKEKNLEEANKNLETSLEKKNNTKEVKKELRKDERSINILLYLVITIAILLLSIVIYLFTNNQKIDTYTDTQIKEEKNISSNNSEENLILINNKKDNDEKIVEVKTVEKKPKEIIKIKEAIKEKIVTKTIKLDKKNFKEYYNSSKYNSLKCYNFKAGDIFPSSQCKSDLKKFLFTNKNAIRFEVIPVIAEEDNKIFNEMKSNIKDMDKDFQKKVKDYMFRGLSRERVLETSWIIKDTLGEDTILTPTNYYVKSKKNNKGIIIKAYH